MKKLLAILIITITIAGCSAQKETVYPQTFEEAEAWFDKLHKESLAAIEKN